MPSSSCHACIKSCRACGVYFLPHYLTNYLTMSKMLAANTSVAYSTLGTGDQCVQHLCATGRAVDREGLVSQIVLFLDKKAQYDVCTNSAYSPTVS